MESQGRGAGDGVKEAAMVLEKPAGPGRGLSYVFRGTAEENGLKQEDC